MISIDILKVVNVLCLIAMGLIFVSIFYLFFKLLHCPISNYNRIEKESKHLLDIEFEEGKMDKNIYYHALSLVYELCRRNIYGIKLDCTDETFSINIREYSIFLELDSENIDGYIHLNPDRSTNHIKFVFNISNPMWQHDTCSMIVRAITMKERK